MKQSKSSALIHLINRVAELGFLKELKGNQNSFEVRRIIKAQFECREIS